MFRHSREREQWIPTIGPFRTAVGTIREMPVESSSYFSRALLLQLLQGINHLKLESFI